MHRGESKLAHDVVMKLLGSNQEKEHCVVMDDFFTNIGILKNWQVRELLQPEPFKAMKWVLCHEFKDPMEFTKSP